MMINPKDVGKGSSALIDPKERPKLDLKRKIQLQHDIMYFESGRPKFDISQYGIGKRKDGQWALRNGAGTPLDESQFANMGAQPAYLARENELLAQEKKAKEIATRQANAAKGFSQFVYGSPVPYSPQRDAMASRSVLQGLVGGKASGRRVLLGA